MITKKLHSPFLFVFTMAIVFGIGCKRSDSCTKSKQAALVEKQLNDAAQTGFPLKARLDHATIAYETAINTDSAYLVWKAFGLKYALLQTKFPAKSEAFLKLYQKSAKKHQDTINLANAYFENGKRFAAAEKPDSAYFYFNASRMLCAARKDSLATVEKIMNMAYLHFTYNDFAEFENITTETLKYLNKRPQNALDSTYISLAYNNYGIAYSNTYDYKNAQQYYKKALALNPDPAFKASVTNNLALVFADDGDHNTAIQMFSRLLESNLAKSDTVFYARVLDNYGYSLLQLKDPAADQYLFKAFEIRNKQADDFELVPSAMHLAEYYQQNNPEKATAFAILAYQKATKLRSTEDRLTALKWLSQNTGNQNKRWFSNYITLKDSIDQLRQKAKNQFAKIKYDSKSANEENLKLKALQAENKLQIEQQKTSGLLIVLAALIATGLAVYIYIRAKAQKRKTVHDTETRIAKQLHDELANDMHHTMTLADSLNATIPSEKEQLLQHLEKLYQRTRKISKENQDIDTGPSFPKMLKEMIGDYHNATVNAISSGIEDIPWEQLSRDKKITVHRIVQEWLVNMKKHSQCNVVVVKFEKQGKKIVVSYQDNGVGMGENVIILKGGLQNVETRIRAINGSIIFGNKSAKGFHAEISFPI